MGKKILILGNGFDLDLGLKSRYRDYLQSHVWKTIKEENPSVAHSHIIQYLETKNEIQTWFDAETELLNYALESTENVYASSNSDDKQGFILFCQGLKRYLRIEQERYTLNKDSVAIKLVENIVRNEFFDEVYSFNYTDMKSLMSHACIDMPSKVVYMHGSLAQHDDIILGIETDKPIHNDYRFLFKTNSRFYSSNSLIESMEKADEIIFFGHSINGMDFPYFKEFFTKQAYPAEGFQRKYITFFTYDTDSSQRIKNNFRESGINPRDLMQRNVMNFIETKSVYNGDNFENTKMETLFKHLREDSKEKERQQIRNLSAMF